MHLHSLGGHIVTMVVVGMHFCILSMHNLCFMLQITFSMTLQSSFPALLVLVCVFGSQGRHNLYAIESSR